MNQALRDSVRNVRNDMEDITRATNAYGVTLGVDGAIGGGVDDKDRWEMIGKRMDNFEDEISNLNSDTPSAIYFHNLGFCGTDKENAWIEKHSPGGKYGLLIDFHTLMEHIDQKIRGVDSLNRLEKMHKIQLTSNSEAVAVASFETICT